MKLQVTHATLRAGAVKIACVFGADKNIINAI